MIWCMQAMQASASESALAVQVMAGAEGAGDVARPGCGLGGNLDVAVWPLIPNP